MMQHDRTIGSLRFERKGLTWRVWNLRHGEWYFVGALDVFDRHPFIESNEQLVTRAKDLAARRGETLEDV